MVPVCSQEISTPEMSSTPSSAARARAGGDAVLAVVIGEGDR